MTLLVDAAREAGISYRQADHWCACRYINAEFYSSRRGDVVPASKGSGRVRRLSAEEVRVLHVMARLVAAGIDPARASKLARSGEPPYELAPGVHLTVLELEEV